MDRQLSDLDPNEVLSVADACAVLKISRPTLYRLVHLKRVRVSPGRVGYRVGDLLEHVRGQASIARQPVFTNMWVDFGGDVLPDHLLSLPMRVSTIVRRRASSPPQTFSIELPRARDWWHAGHKELVLIDYDGLNGSEPMVVIPQEDEHVGPRAVGARLTITEPHALVRLTPLVGWPEEMPGGWWVG